MTNTAHVLYRFFNAAGDLLYVGITVDPTSRWRTHAHDKPWWHDVTRIELETHPDRTSVLEAERAAIIAEHPRHNVVHNRRPGGAPTPTATYDSDINLWTFTYRRNGYQQTTDLFLSWEVDGTAISDDWLPQEIDAADLLTRWVQRYGDNPRPAIYWSLDPIQETAPFQPAPFDDQAFLRDFTWPRHAHTGALLNFNRLPVKDGTWNADQHTKGGFFQEATGWKPSPLQTHVDLPQLLQAAGRTGLGGGQ